MSRPAASVEEARAVTAANAELYAAFESGDVTRLERLWDDAEDVVCIHPGWDPVRGRSRVLRSWAAIMANTLYVQFFVTDVHVDVTGDVAVVTCQHSILTGVTSDDDGLGETARVVATNVFRRRAGEWRLWVHHGSPVLSGEDDE